MFSLFGSLRSSNHRIIVRAIFCGLDPSDATDLQHLAGIGIVDRDRAEHMGQSIAHQVAGSYTVVLCTCSIPGL